MEVTTIRKVLLGSNIKMDEENSTVSDFLTKQLHRLLHFLENSWAFLVDKFNQAFPVETREDTLHKWAHFGLTRVLPIGLVLLFLYCCCCRCCCRCGGGARRMMRAPGSRGAIMPRANFEADPRGYFLNLRTGKDLLY